MDFPEKKYPIFLEKKGKVIEIFFLGVPSSDENVAKTVG